tara:strand:- start:1869 stop:2180 length:312 start_codon:yes stop_codon:yes gene_type:complete
MPNSIRIVREFQDIILSEASIRWGEDFTVKDVVYHLAESGIISPKTLRNYMMFKDFDKYIVDNQGHIGNTLIDISIKHNISEKQCRNIIYKQRYKFLKESNIR